MNRWIAVRLSAALNMLGSLATLLFAGIMVWTGWFAQPPDTAVEPPIPLKGIMTGLTVFFTGFSVWGFLTGIGIFRRRGWARLSIMIFAVLLVGMGGSALLGTLFIKLPANASVTPQMMMYVRIGIAVFYGAMTAVGVWWLLLFNSARTKQYFAEAAPGAAAAEGGRPLSISVIGWYLLITTLLTAVAAILRIPGMLFGAVVSGWAAFAVYTVFAAVNLYLGSGLLQLQEPARIGSIVYFLLVAANSVVTVVLPEFPTRLQRMQEAFPRFLQWSQQQPLPMESVWRFGLIGALIAVAPIWFLVRRRAAFASKTGVGG